MSMSFWAIPASSPSRREASLVSRTSKRGAKERTEGVWPLRPVDIVVVQKAEERREVARSVKAVEERHFNVCDEVVNEVLSLK